MSFKKRQTPACCVGDRLKECQHKHSQTTCSPRAEGLASLQAHLHTIPQLSASEPRRQSGKGGKGEGREKSIPRQGEPICYVKSTMVSVMKVMTSDLKKQTKQNKKTKRAREMMKFKIQTDKNLLSLKKK